MTICRETIGEEESEKLKRPKNQKADKMGIWIYSSTRGAF